MQKHKNHPFVTVFTPTYNRAYIIEKLYVSLCNQTNNQFEWLIIDDGSTDNIDEIVERFIAEKKINIKYLKQPNKGKHAAINNGVCNSSGDLFFIVDSDDYLKENAIELICQAYYSIDTNDNIAGIGFMRCSPNGDKIGSKLPFENIICNAFHLTYKIKATGDMAEVYKTDILRNYPFPEISGEKFCPEAMVWFRIARKYQMLWINKAIYVCEYLDDGLTKSITKVRHRSPKTSMLFYNELYNDVNSPLTIKIKAAINYWRFSFSDTSSLFDKIKKIGLLPSLLIPFGWFMYKNDLR